VPNDLCETCPYRDECQVCDPWDNATPCKWAGEVADQDRVDPSWREELVDPVDPAQIPGDGYTYNAAIEEVAYRARHMRPDVPVDLGEVEWAHVEQCVHLTRRQREILRLYFWDRYTQAEIGEMLGITRQAVADAVSRGLTSLSIHIR